MLSLRMASFQSAKNIRLGGFGVGVVFLVKLFSLRTPAMFMQVSSCLSIFRPELRIHGSSGEINLLGAKDNDPWGFKAYAAMGLACCFGKILDCLGD